MRKLIMKSFMAVALFLSMFLPVQANDQAQLTIAQTQEENKIALSLSGVSNTNALSLNLAIEGDVRLMNIQPSDYLLAKGARLNYTYNEEKNSVDIYITSKENLVENGKIEIGSMYIASTNEFAKTYTITTNTAKDELKTVSNNRAETLKNGVSLTVETGNFQTSGSIDESTPDVPQESTLVDANTGIRVTGEFEAGTTLSVAEIEDKDELTSIKDMLSKVSNKFKAYDIRLSLNGQDVQPKGNVSVYVPIPADYDAQKIGVYYKGTSNHTEMKVKVENGYAVFETTHFSTYVLAEKNIDETEEILPPSMDDSEGEGDAVVGGDNQTSTGATTGDSTNTTLLIGILVVAGAALGFIVYKNKKDKEKNK